MELAAELAEVVITVKISPTHPFSTGKRAKYRVGWPWAFHADESIEMAEDAVAIGEEVAGYWVQFGLADLWRSLYPSRPLNGRTEGQPFEHRDRNGPCFERGHGEFAEWATEGIREMAQHLMNTHQTPSTCVGRADEGNARANRGQVFG